MNELLIICGLVLGGFALRTFASAWLRRMGNLLIIVATYETGVAIFEEAWVGWLLASLWIMVPMVHLTLMTRNLKMPLNKQFRPRHAPSQEIFPELGKLTEEFEEAGFAQMEDIGWDWENLQQFSRLMFHEALKLQGTIHLNQQGPMALSHAMLVTRTEDGKVWTSSNYPFSPSLKRSPDLELNRLPMVTSLAEMMEQHAAFLKTNGITQERIIQPETERLLDLEQAELRRQIDHNLDEGLLRLAGEGFFTYSWRGTFFMLRQFMLDFLKYS